MCREVFLIGDTISVQYGPYLERKIKGEYILKRKNGREQFVFYDDIPLGENGGNSRQVLKYLKESKFSGRRFDILLLNCGLHDVEINRDCMESEICLDEYINNLEEIASIAQEMSNEVIWINTAPVHEEAHEARWFEPFRYNKDIKLYNYEAEKIMRIREIKVIKMYKLLEQIERDIHWDHVHFIDEIRILQANIIACELFNISNQYIQG